MALRNSKERAAAVQRKRVLHVDDHPIICRAVAELLELEPDLVACPPAHEAPSALESIQKSLPDIVIVDLSLPGMSGLELIREIATRFPGLPMLVFSTHDETLYAEQALRAGARGYLMKEAPPEELVAALRRIMAGQVYLGERMTRAVLDKLGRGEGTDLSFSPADRLTPRELAVFRLIGQGLTTRQIAAELSLSTKTIEGYAAKIKEKLGLHNFVQLQQRAALWVKAMPPEHGTPS